MNDAQFVDRFGPWALVTGASSGIGAAFATALAAKGLNVVLASRTERALDTLAVQLEAMYRVETRVVGVDLSQPGSATAEIGRTTDDLDVGLLISNAGASAMGAMLKVDPDALGETLALNTEAHLRLSHHFGTRLVARGRGGMLLVGSMAGMQGTPLGANYAGAKAYVHNLGQALNYELRKTGVNVSVVVPGPTSTPGLNDRTDIDLSKVPGPVMSAEKLAAIGLKGLNKNKPLVIAGAPNRLMSVVFGRLMPRQAARNVMGSMMMKHAPAELVM